ncbi:MAG: hypothetical protein K2Q20_06650 [Phycisphaerales bacterium]|nr:hypothetical protein [Phycisphaerales bacterium]
MADRAIEIGGAATAYGDAADLAAMECYRGQQPVGFAVLEEPETHQAMGVVLVCLDPALIDRVVQFVHSLGNFNMRVHPDPPPAKTSPTLS